MSVLVARSRFSRTPWWSFVIDLAFVVVFVLIGRRSHGESDAITGLLTTAWPFVTGLIFGWLCVIGIRWPFITWQSGGIVWVVTVFVGMLLRHQTGQGVVVSFVIVASVFLGLTLLGWRIALIQVAKRRGAAMREVPRGR